MENPLAKREYLIKISVSLVDRLRDFQMKNHEYIEGFIEAIGIHLEQLKQKNPDLKSLQEDHLSNHSDISVDLLLLAIHFIFGSISNVDQMLKFFGHSGPISDLSKSHVNRTNILNIHSINDALIALRAERPIGERAKIPKSEFLEKFELIITSGEEDESLYEAEGTRFNIDMIIVSITSRGKYDPYAVSYFCTKINQKHHLSLCPIYFVYCPKNEHKMLYTNSFGDTARATLAQLKNVHFTEEKYKNFVHTLVYHKELKAQDPDLLLNLTTDIEEELCHNLFFREKKAMDLLEKLFIGMLGHEDVVIRDAAVRNLNVFYDRVEWQLKGAFKPKIEYVGNKFWLTYLIENEEKDSHTIMMLVSAKSFSSKSNQTVISWHKPKIQDYKAGHNFVLVSFELGDFTKCGFHDWKLVRLQRSGKVKGIYKIYNLDDLKTHMSLSHLLKVNSEKSKPVQGRFIVQPNDSRKLQIHEVFVDFQEILEEKQGNIIKKGNFSKVASTLSSYRDRDINCLYLMGALERDNGKEINQKTGEAQYSRPEVSPLAITCRKTPCSMMGGEKEFKNLLKEAKRLDVKIIVDCLTRVSSARHHKKYKGHLLHCLDNEGKKMACYGTDGRSLNFEDTVLLNYRKKEVWDLLENEINELAYSYGIDGVHLDNGQAWPEIYALDVKEMHRKDPDGTPAYSDEEIFQGEIVLQNEQSGYWSSDAKDKYANPFMVRLCKSLWRRHPNFLIIAETWGGPGFENRELNIIRSGPIPRLFNLPMALAQILGQKLNRDGTIEQIERKNVNIFRTWYENVKKLMPPGSIFVQSTTSHIWPYPALLYKKGLWPAIDVFFFLPDIPMTFIGENEGHAYRAKTATIFTKLSVKEKSQEVSLEERRGFKLKETDFERSRRFTMGPQMRASASSKALLHEVNKTNKMFDEINPQKLKTVIEKEDNKGKVFRVASGISISELGMHQLKQAEEKFQKELATDSGFDPKDIGRHYEHRRHLRNKREALLKGKFIPLLAENETGIHSHVLAFARHYNNEIAIVAINFNSQPVSIFINLRSLRFLFEDPDESDLVVKVEDWLDPKNDKVDYFTVGETVNDRHYAYLGPYATLLWGVTIYNEDPVLEKVVFERSLRRLTKKIEQGQTVFRNQISDHMVILLNMNFDTQNFINGFSYFVNNILLPYNISLSSLVSIIRDIRDETSLSCKLFSYCKIISEMSNTTAPELKQLPCTEMAAQLVNNNNIGKIVFVTAEIAPWTVVGGLGVMVQELTQGLAKLREDIIVISPYYNEIRRGVTNYLYGGDSNFQYVMNIDIKCGVRQYTLGVHEGVVEGVRLFFLHNAELFPYPYAEGQSEFRITQLVLFAKGALELLCQIKLIPRLIVTNDWFTGLVPCYAKNNSFGTVFKETIFFHVLHNIGEDYDCRIPFSRERGSFKEIHELNEEHLFDVNSQVSTISPTRCAIINCDQWGTVSDSYKKDIVRNSPFSNFLKPFPRPFGFPNGIPKQQRFQKIMDLCGNDHLEAKRRVQQQYFKFSDLDNTICLIAFVGRITRQKGVHLILESFERLNQKYQGKIQILIGGRANLKEEYGMYCSNLMWKLKQNHPYNFWAQPGEFFEDGTLINIGADYGIMPSIMEPGGIVQHEFFVASTPVIASKIGGLRDTVVEWDTLKKTGNGFTFQELKAADLMSAIDRAYETFKNEKSYDRLRKSAFETVVDVSDVARAWDREFHRLFGKIFIDYEVYENQLNLIEKKFDQSLYKEECPFKKKKGKILTPEDEIKKNFEKLLSAHKRTNIRKCVFTIATTKVPRPKNIYLCGTFDDWKTKHRLNYDYFKQNWSCTINLMPGGYYYKYILDDEWICSNEDPKVTDIYGNVNNYIEA